MLFYHQLKCGIRRSAFAITLVLLLAISASAYTVVMRNGRRVEIPEKFTVTRTTLTYEVSPGIQVTLQMQAINIGATERANGEQPGTFLRRAQPSVSSMMTPPIDQPTGAARTITNRDLQAAKERRVRSEVAYDKRVKELGLPTLEESRQRAAAESAVIGAELREIRAGRSEEEQYWRSRASALRGEMAAIDAEIEYVGARIDEYPSPNGNNTITSVTTVEPYVYGDLGRRRRNRRNNSGVFDPWGRRDGYYDPRNRGPYGWGNIGGYPPVVTGPYGSGYDYTYERSQLVTRFNELAGKRAALRSRWRDLENEARRAGASPGWLRE
ncbi:MAG TPA: hypothetical protein VIT88_04310 [Pyrinomonadaceae bacterium]